MSYDIVKNISIKNRTITLAANNIRPITYETCKINAESDESLIKYVLVNALWGNFQFQNNKNLLKFRLALDMYDGVDIKIRNDIYAKVWKRYDYKTKTQLYTQEEVEEATKKLGDILYDLYNSIELTKGKYIINYYDGYAYISNLRKESYCYTLSRNKAKIYNTLEEATLANKYLERYFTSNTKVEAL